MQVSCDQEQNNKSSIAVETPEENEKESSNKGKRKKKERGRWSGAMTSWQGKQNSSRAEKLNTNQSEQGLRECYVARREQLAACGHL